jgi:hypothetical protein
MWIFQDTQGRPGAVGCEDGKCGRLTANGVDRGTVSKGSLDKGALSCGNVDGEEVRHIRNRCDKIAVCRTIESRNRGNG